MGNLGHLGYREGQKRVGRGIMDICIVDLIVSHHIGYDTAGSNIGGGFGHRASE